MKDKRGAIELSITTIVVVVIGITLLTLGLVWVSGIFDKLSGTTEGAFQQVDTQIDEILGQGTGKWLSLSPSTISLKKGETSRVKIIFENIDQSGASHNFKSTVDCQSGISARFADDVGGTLNSRTYTLKPAYRAEVTAILTETGAPLGTRICTFDLDPGTFPADTGADSSRTLSVQVVR